MILSGFGVLYLSKILRMKNKIGLLLILLVVVANGCHKSDKGFKKHPSGLSYRFFEMNPEGKSPKPGDIVVLSLRIETGDGKVMDESAFYRLQLGKPMFKGDFYTGLALFQVGDSACLKLDAAGYYEKTRKRDLPVEFQQGDPVYIFLRLKNILSSQDLDDEKASLYHTDREQELNLLRDFIKLTNTTVQPTASGLYYVEQKAGTGRKAENGRTLVVHYTGKTIDGKIFDSSLQRGRPIEFVLGQGQVIKGWDEAFLMMKEGGKARLIIPSDLAYGKQGYSNIILPYSTLEFDVELLEVR